MIAKQVYLNNREHHNHFETEPLDVIQPSSTLVDESFIEDLLALMQDIAKNYRFSKGYRFNRHRMYEEDDRYQRFS